MVISIKVDEIDKQILRALQRDGRQSIQDMSGSVGLSATPVARRIRALEASKIILGYTVLCDEAAIGFSVSVFVSVRLDKQVDDALVKFERAIGTFPEVVDCWLMTGNRDYMLRVATSDLREFEQFLTGKLTKLPGVAAIESSIPLRRVKSSIARIV